MKNIKDFNLDELQEELVSIGEKKYRAEQIFKWIYVEKVKEFDEMTNLSLELREKLKANYTMCNYQILRKQESSDGTKNIYLMYLIQMLLKQYLCNIIMERLYVFLLKLDVRWGVNFVHQLEFNL